MKYCPHCGAPIDDNAAFCIGCGAKVGSAATTDLGDHTAEFDKEDIARNKLFAMLPYLLGVVGVILAQLIAHDSVYVRFHIRQGVKLLICRALVWIATLTLFWTCIVLFAGVAAQCVLLVLSVIAFCQVCAGKAKEPAIIRSIGFLN